MRFYILFIPSRTFIHVAVASSGTLLAILPNLKWMTTSECTYEYHAINMKGPEANIRAGIAQSVQRLARG
jgi:hypothetical protein